MNAASGSARNLCIAAASVPSTCRVFDATGREVGSAYMELTGYAAELKL